MSWKTVNPCEGCDMLPDVKAVQCIGRKCRAQDKYLEAIDAQRKLLEYLISQHVVGKKDNLINSMLKELNEEKK